MSNFEKNRESAPLYSSPLPFLCPQWRNWADGWVMKIGLMISTSKSWHLPLTLHMALDRPFDPPLYLTFSIDWVKNCVRRVPLGLKNMFLFKERMFLTRCYRCVPMLGISVLHLQSYIKIHHIFNLNEALRSKHPPWTQ